MQSPALLFASSNVFPQPVLVQMAMSRICKQRLMKIRNFQNARNRKLQ